MNNNAKQDNATNAADLARGLPMVSQWEPEALAAEREWLRTLSTKPLTERCRAYLSKTGPGWLQSAITLGSGTAGASLFAGAFLGYKLLWVQPVAMALGVVMLSAVAYQTLSTGARPFDAMRRYIHPGVAWTWAIASLVATVIWHFPQYALAGGVSQDIIKAVTNEKVTVPVWAIGLIFFVVSTFMTWTYGKHARGIHIYEWLLKCMVGAIIIAFAVLILCTGVDWGRLARGFFGFYIPRDTTGISVMMGAFGAAVGINMTFLYPYTLLAKGWGREHRGLALFDRLSGMLIPYVIATTLIIVASANTLQHSVVVQEAVAKGSTFIPADKAAQVLEPVLDISWARVVFGLGILGMCLSTITLHMLVSAFIVCEVFGWEPTGWRYRIAALIPVPGLLGTVLWGKIGMWIAVPTSAVCGVLLPIAYVAFFILHNKKEYLGTLKPSGLRAFAWNIAMGLAILVSSASALYFLWSALPAYVGKLCM